MDEITLDDFLAYLEKYGVLSCDIRDALSHGRRHLEMPAMREYLLDPSGFLAANHGLTRNELFAELIRRVS